jgi:hypothetical protein
MATIERVIQMKQQGMSDTDIVNSLRQEGISPKEISESISQSNIKLALNQEPQDNQAEMNNSMQQSIMTTERPVDSEGYTDYSGNPAPSPDQQAQIANQEQVYQEYYPEYQQQYQEYQPQQSLDIETVNDIAEQLIEEKTEKLEKQISAFTKFREEIQFDVQKMNERLAKIESKFDELQMAIIKKIGDYGRDIQNISKEMYLTQESFSKILDPLTDNIRALQDITVNRQGQTNQRSPQTSSQNSSRTQENNNNQESQEDEQSERQTLKKQKADFESYLR